MAPGVLLRRYHRQCARAHSTSTVSKSELAIQCSDAGIGMVHHCPFPEHSTESCLTIAASDARDLMSSSKWASGLGPSSWLGLALVSSARERASNTHGSRSGRVREGAPGSTRPAMRATVLWQPLSAGVPARQAFKLPSRDGRPSPQDGSVQTFERSNVPMNLKLIGRGGVPQF